MRGGSIEGEETEGSTLYELYITALEEGSGGQPNGIEERGVSTYHPQTTVRQSVPSRESIPTEKKFNIGTFRVKDEDQYVKAGKKTPTTFST